MRSVRRAGPKLGVRLHSLRINWRAGVADKPWIVCGNWFDKFSAALLRNTM